MTSRAPSLRHAPADWHCPVMRDEVADILSKAPDGILLDATVGGGGHAAAALERHSGLQLVGLARDPNALRAAAARLRWCQHRVTLIHGRFDALAFVLDDLGYREISAALFDLGVSSAQLGQAGRGFSFRLEGPLDMRMDPTGGLTAAEIVNAADETFLRDLLRRNSDERFAGRISRAIVAARPLTTTTELAAVVSSAVPTSARRRGHPARRTFQALRIEVNSELETLSEAISDAIERLVPGGRCVVLAYHSGEDRIVKTAMRRAAGHAPPQPRGLPPAVVPVKKARLLWRKPRTASTDERQLNPRASSARMRAVERVSEES